MKKLIYSLLFLFAVGVFSSCELEKLPYSSIGDDAVLNSEGGVYNATLGNYSFLKSEYFVKPYHYIPEFGSDNVALSGSTTDGLFYLYNLQRNKANGHLSGLWTNSFKVIVACNKILEAVEVGQSPEMDVLIGENHYLRGFLYFTLVNAFGRPYSHDNGSHLGVPLKLTADINEYPTRATVAAVYEQIEKDLLKAEELLSSDKNACYASKEVAQALLSRMYLYMDNRTKCVEYSNKVINSGRYSLLQGNDYKKYPEHLPEENDETIFALRHINGTDLPGKDSGWGIWRPYLTVGAMYAHIDGMGWGEMYASSSLRDVMNDYPQDYRHAFIEPQFIEDDNGQKTRVVQWTEEFFDADQGHERYRYVNKSVLVDSEANKYYFEEEGVKTYVETEVEGDITRTYIMLDGEKQYAELTYKMHERRGYPKYFVVKCSRQEGETHNWSPIVSRLAEMYLNRAECYAKDDNTDLALADLKTIRERANIPAYTAVPAGKTILDLVLQERRLELAYEGHRKYDIFRNKLTLDRRYPGTHDLGSATAVRLEVPYTANEVVCFIPQSEIDAYPVELEQNP